VQAEVIAIGDELTSGQRLDTNSRWISTQLGELGIPVGFHSAVGDQLDACRDVFRHAISRAQIVVATGGLGPTADDLTREAMAAAAGVQLERDEKVLAEIREKFRRRGRQMPPRNEVQALFPSGSQVIPNPHGTAPGIDLTVSIPDQSPCRVFALPGVPAELKEMWEQTVAPRLRERSGAQQVIRHRRVKCFGVGESHLEQLLPELICRGRDPEVGITVHEATITLRITARADSEASCEHLIEPTRTEIERVLGSLVFGEEDEELEHAICTALTGRGQRLALAEWGTAGMLGQWLSAAQPAAGPYAGGWLIHDRRSAERLADSPRPRQRQHPQRDMVRALAGAVRCQFDVDFGLATGPLPLAESAEHQFHVALATPAGMMTRSFPYAAHPAILKPLSAKRALNLLRLHLLGEET